MGGHSFPMKDSLRHLRRYLLPVLDSFIYILVTSLGLLLLTGGFRYEIWGLRFSLQSFNNPLRILAIALFLRHLLEEESSALERGMKKILSPCWEGLQKAVRASSWPLGGGVLVWGCLGLSIGATEALMVRSLYPFIPNSFLDFFAFILMTSFLYGFLFALAGLFISGNIVLIGRRFARNSIDRKGLKLSLDAFLIYLAFFHVEMVRFNLDEAPVAHEVNPLLLALLTGGGFGFLVLFALSMLIVGKKGRSVLTLFVAVTFLALAWLGFWIGDKEIAQKGQEQGRPKHIILITIDTLRADYLGCYGQKEVETPYMDRLSRKGALFEQAYSQVPQTTPSHTSIFTSLYPQNNGVLRNCFTLSDSYTTLAEVLKSYGFATGAFVSRPVLKARYGLNQGFDVYAHAWRWDNNLAEKLYDLWDREDSLPFMDSVSKTALRWLEHNQGRKAFLWVHWFHPHRPYEPPPPFGTLYTKDYKGPYECTEETLSKIHKEKIALSPEDIDYFRGMYGGEVTYSDLQVGFLMEKMDKLNLWEDSLLILTADHGESLYDHEYFFGHSVLVYECTLRVPLIIVMPSKVPQGKRINSSFVRSIDIMPTLLSLAEIPLGEGDGIDGRDFSSLLLGKVADSHGLQKVMSVTYASGMEKVAIRNGRWKLHLNSGDSKVELYDIEEDPEEKQNLASAMPEKIAELKSQWLELTKQLKRPREQRLDKESLEILKSLGYIQ